LTRTFLTVMVYFVKKKWVIRPQFTILSFFINIINVKTPKI
jgi:hypothetical protein